VLDYAVCHWIALYKLTVHFTAFCLGGGAFFPGRGVLTLILAAFWKILELLCAESHFFRI